SDFITLSLALWCWALACGWRRPSSTMLSVLGRAAQTTIELAGQPREAEGATHNDPLLASLWNDLDSLTETPDRAGESAEFPGTKEEFLSAALERFGHLAGGSPELTVNALGSAYLISAELRKRRFSSESSTGLDFVLDCMAEELLVITVATA